LIDDPPATASFETSFESSLSIVSTSEQPSPQVRKLDDTLPEDMELVETKRRKFSMVDFEKLFSDVRNGINCEEIEFVQGKPNRF
jgi:hypothetical protein